MEPKICKKSLNSIQKLNKSINKKTNSIILGLGIVFIVAFVLFIGAIYFVTKDNKAPDEFIVTPQIIEDIDSYLIANVGISGFKGKVFCSFELMGSEYRYLQDAKLYLWVLCQEYYLENDILKKGSGLSVPITLLLTPAPGTYKPIMHEQPGYDYAADIKRIFPKKYQNLIFHQIYKGSVIDSLNAEVLNKAKNYYQN